MIPKRNFRKDKDKGFTLIELLVVIAIITLLMAVLIPGLNKARDHAKYILCASRLRQFGIMYEIYTQANDESLPGGWNSGTMWITDLLQFYKGEDEIRLCPKATLLLQDVPNNAPGVLTAWGKYGNPNFFGGATPVWAEPNSYGSYGVNGWAHNPPDIGVTKKGTKLYDIPEADRPKFWRKAINVKHPDSVPLMADAMWDGTTPEMGDRPPSKPIPPNGGENWVFPTSDMSKYIVPRHSKMVNMLFIDKSMRKVGIKELWTFRWHTEWQETLVNWNKYEWIRQYPEGN